MAAPNPQNLLGCTLDFGTSAWDDDGAGITALITGISHSGCSRPAINTSHIGLTAYNDGAAVETSAFGTFIPGAIIDPGELTLDVIWTHHDQPPISQAAETFTLTLRSAVAADTDGVLASSGFVTAYQFAGERDGGWEGSVTIKLTGDTSWTDAVSA